MTALELVYDEVAYGPDGLCHAIKAVPRGTRDAGGYEVWTCPTSETLCGERSIYPSERWQLKVTWHREHPVTCTACRDVMEQQEFDW